MIQYENIEKAMGVEIAMSQDMKDAIYKWSRMYQNKSPWIEKGIKGLNLPAAISSEMARLVTMEAKIKVSGSPAADMIDNRLERFRQELPRNVEYACSSGGIVFKPYVENGKIEIDTVRAGYFYPVSFDSAGDITACIFPEFKRKGKKLYTRLEYHELENGTYRIENRAFVSRKAIVKTDNIINLGQEISLEDVPEWEEIAPYVEFHNANCMLFSYFRIPIANNIDPESPLGVSVYSRAVNQIQDADEQYGATIWEFRSKETAVQAADEFFKHSRDGKAIIPKGQERVYHAMGAGIRSSNGAPFFNVYSPEIRDESFYRGYNRIVQKIEFNSGLAYGTLSDPQNVDKTAEEIKASKQRSYATVKTIQNSLGQAIKNLTDAMLAWCAIEEIVPLGQVEVSCDWDDSLIVDKKYETEQLRADLSVGAVGLVEYRMKRFNETKEQAIEMLKLVTEFDSDDLEE